MIRRPAFLVALLLAASPAAALQCGSRDTVTITLAERYGEVRQALGLAQNGVVMELYAAQSGSWTIIITRPDGMTCLLAAGEDFQPTPQTPPPPGDPA
ncbi:hypothetical protein [Paragemmobacter ruber]|uniref:Uncharacterized protein n=1 Tax=Paragemmobacter ruber TaxID=1985673 RepID=A0ABW9Y1Z2_9RHOB|nr:hypothetical protein [Rhodobacter ruber]NBE06526.1 hypothetical protein [Rhodobacter ruber]